MEVAGDSGQEASPWLARAASSLALGSAFLAGLYRIRTFDTFFHLAAGAAIWRRGVEPREDPFSFTHRGALWLDHSWGFQLLIDRLFALGGFAALSLYQAALSCLLCASSLDAVGTVPAMRCWGALLSVLPMLAHREVLEARPHLLGFACLALTLLVSERARRDGKLALAVIGLYALWATVHGSHPLALVLGGLSLLDALLHRRFHAAAYWTVTLAACAALCAWLAPDALTQGTEHLASSFLEGSVSEWYPVRLGELLASWPGRAFLLIVSLTVAGAALSAGDPRAPRGLLPWLQLAMLLVLAFTSRRMLALFALAAQPLWLPYAALAATRGCERVHRATAGGIASLIGTCGVLLALLTGGGPYQLGVGLAEDRFPEAAVAWMRAHPRITRVYNAYNFGGYLIWAAWPPAGVFVDGRAITVYPPAFLAAFERAYDDPLAFEVLVERHRVDGVLMPTQSARVQRLRTYLGRSERWQLRYRDPVAEVYELQPAPR